MYKQIVKCRGCGSTKFADVIDLGTQYIVDFVKNPGDGDTAPLTLVRCTDCSLVQLKHSVDPDRLYKKFWYRSGINEQMRDELLRIVQRAQAAVGFPGDKQLDYVLDIGCNDGTLLGWYDKGRYVTVGVDPCNELVQEGCKTTKQRPKLIDYGIGTYFSKDIVEQVVPGKKFKIITAISMFYDLEDPLKFLEDCKALLHEDGVLIIQMNYLVTMYANMAFDNICHEHLTYFSVHSLAKLIERAGLDLQGIEQNMTNGGSIRAYITHPKTTNFFPLDRETRVNLYGKMVNAMSVELKIGIDTDSPAMVFRANVRRRMEALLNYLSTCEKRIFVYGASTRGTTLMQYLATLGDTDYISEAAERDPHKYGLYMVGTWTKIVPEAEARKNAEVFLVLPWHFRESIEAREQAFLEKGGELVFPLPIPQVKKANSLVELSQEVGA